MKKCSIVATFSNLHSTQARLSLFFPARRLSLLIAESESVCECVLEELKEKPFYKGGGCCYD